MKGKGSKKAVPASGGSSLEPATGSGVLANISMKAVGKLLRRASKKSSLGTRNCKNHPEQDYPDDTPENRDKKLDMDQKIKWNALEAEGCSKDTVGNASTEEVDGGTFQQPIPESMEDMDDSDWEDGSTPMLDAANSHPLTIEISEMQQTPDSAKQKPIRRASAADKESAELVHKVHLLCLLARGRLIDRACDDPLIQAALLSLLPTHLLKISEVKKLTAKSLHPLVTWFHDNFHIKGQVPVNGSFHSALAYALENHEGTSEEIAALSVALFRALNLTTRFVSILDVASIKPDAEKSESFSQDAGRSSCGIFNSSTLMVTRPKQVSSTPVKSLFCDDKHSVSENSSTGIGKSSESASPGKKTPSKDMLIHDRLSSESSSLNCKGQADFSKICLTKGSQGSKRKGDLEFEMQLEMALSATSVATQERASGVSELNCTSSKSHFPKRRKLEESSSSFSGVSIAVGSSKVGSPLYWAEVYCSAENLTGKWVHVDAVNMIIDGEYKVEALTAALKTSLRYVVAFAGNGAKEVTRRYCMRWYKIESQRVNRLWWDAVLAPLRILEEEATRGTVDLENKCIDESTGHEKVKAPGVSDASSQDGCNNNEGSPGKLDLKVPEENGEKIDRFSSLSNAFVATRSCLEDMELETRALTEPLPTNQQAYRSHRLYAIEKWLTKYQILHPKGPILGFCSGHPVYPRTSVQTLKTKERWLREGLQVKSNELPAKELKRSTKNYRVQEPEDDDHGDDDCRGVTRLYGKWQLEPLDLPQAVNGIVPKNERGQVEVWSEKCLPPGTVHLKLPRVSFVARRLEIDYAPAMVGFEFRNGQSYPVFDGIAVCREFKDAVLEAYAEEEERREAEEKRRNERQAISRWYQLLSSILTRQRLNSRYGEYSSQTVTDNQDRNRNNTKTQSNNQEEKLSSECHQRELSNTRSDTRTDIAHEHHEHVFLTDDQSFDEESLVLTKRCHCGFSVQVEEL